MRYFVLRVPPRVDDEATASLVLDSESDADLLPELQRILPILQREHPSWEYVIARAVEQ